MRRKAVGRPAGRTFAKNLNLRIDEQTMEKLAVIAGTWQIPESQAVRRAIAESADRMASSDNETKQAVKKSLLDAAKNLEKL